MPRFEAFRALRYAPSLHLDDVAAPPYDVINESERVALCQRHPNNITQIDMPTGEHAYKDAAKSLRQWIAGGVLVLDDVPSLTLYRMQFVDSLGAKRSTVGVLGALEVVDLGAGGVLPHERTTKKATTDRLELTRATDTNMSPVWGLSLANGLSSKLFASGETCGSFTDAEGVVHSVERVTDPQWLDEITASIASSDIVIADGHHRYAVSRAYRDEVRQRTKRNDTAAELTLVYINELVDDQLSVAAIHRLYSHISFDNLHKALTRSFDIELAGALDGTTLRRMNEFGALCLLQADRTISWLKPRQEIFAGVRQLDSAMLEHALTATPHTVAYQHDIEEVCRQLQRAEATAAILIRPVSVAEIRRTATEGLLMPPKSTFFTPKLRTGLVLRPLNTN
ncbi:MAG: DUF1015 domain-containing protein [Ilumatobacteraceae bacterium]